MVDVKLIKNSILVLVTFIISLKISSGSDNWVTHMQVDELKIEFKKQDCVLAAQGFHNVYLFLRFENLTQENLEFTYSQLLWYNGECFTCDAGEQYQFTIQLEPGGVIEAGCNDFRNQGLRLFHSMIKPENKSVLTDFELEIKNISRRK